MGVALRLFLLPVSPMSIILTLKPSSASPRPWLLSCSSLEEGEEDGRGRR